jgi:cytochrome c oxidase subunit 4
MIRTFVIVDALLLALALVSIGLAHVNLYGWNPVLALGIAAIKAALIALFFMELRLTRGMSRIVALAGVLWLAILLVGTLDDVLTRSWLPVPGK